ncbi:MAG: hypothetical protein H6734_26485 [Alphaproteobacteria bacterium]|nr:hypothetical protein [Alphaproteobacteria bacterium]
MTRPFRFYGDGPDDYMGTLHHFVDVVFTHPPSDAERESLAERAYQAMQALGVRLTDGLFSGRYAFFQISPVRGGLPPERLVQALVHALHGAVSLVDAVWLDARFASGPWTRESLLVGRPSAGPVPPVAAVDPALVRPIDPSLPPPSRDPVFDGKLASMRRERRLGIVRDHQPRAGDVGISVVDVVPPGVPAYDPRDPRLADWPELDDLFLGDSPMRNSPGQYSTAEVVAMHRPTRMPVFHPDGTRFLVVSRNVVWEVDVRTRAMRMLCRGEGDETGRLRDAVWLDAEHFAVGSDDLLRAYRLRDDGVVSVSVVRKKGFGVLGVARGGRLLHSVSRDQGAGRTLFVRWDGKLALVGAIDVALTLEGEREGHVYVGLDGVCLEVTRLAEVLAPAPTAPIVDGVQLGSRVHLVPPRSGTGLEARTADRVLTSPAVRGVTCQGLFLDDGGIRHDLGGLLAESIAHHNLNLTNHLAISPSGRTGFVVAGQGPSGLKATVVVFDLDARSVVSTLEHDGKKLGKILSIEPIEDDGLAVFTADAALWVRKSADAWTVAQSRKQKKARAGAVAWPRDRPVLAIPTDSPDGLVLVGLASNGKLKLLDKTGLLVRTVTWHEGRLLAEDGQRSWWEITGLEGAIRALE